MPRLLSGLAIMAASSLVACGGGKASGADPKTGGDDTSNSDTADTNGGDPTTGNQVGNKAHEVAGEMLMGDGPKTIAEGSGQIVIVDFWATFCGPCRKSFPKYQELVDKHAGKLAIIAVSVDDPDDVSGEDVKKFATDLGVSFTVIWDKDKSTAGKYEPKAMPTSFVIDQDGIIRHVHPKFESGDAEKIDAEIEALLK